MKILFYSNILSDGGAERVMANLANAFSEKSHQVTLVATYETPNEYFLSDKVNRLNLELKPSAIRNVILRNFSRIHVLRKIVKNEDPDVIVAFMREANLRAIVATAGLRTKSVISVRCDPVIAYAGSVKKLIIRWLLPLADGCVFQTKEAKEFFCQKLQHKSTIIPNAVKEDFFRVERNPVKNQVVALGRLTKQKNYPMLLEAFRQITAQNPNVQLQIYGDGELRDTIAMQIAELGLDNNIMLMGRTSDVSGVHRKADLFVMSSDFEGMPNSLMEAMAAGVPVISTDCPCGGPRMLIKDGESGLLVPVGDADAMAEAIMQVLSDDVLKAKLGAGAKEAAQNFRPEIINAQWEKYLEDVISGKNKKH